jgi:predicted outer membrane repeat protein
MQTGWRRWTLGAALALAPLAPPALARDVLNVAQPTAPFAELQAAVDAASDGDVLLLQPGVYGSAVVRAKGLTLLALEPGTVEVAGVVIESLAAGQDVQLVGLLVRGPSASSGSAEARAAVRVMDATGVVSIEECTLVGRHATQNASIHGGPALLVEDSLAVGVTASTLTGGAGHGSPHGWSSPDGGNGGAGLEVVRSRVAVAGSVLTGGAGGNDADLGGRGGAGLRALGPQAQAFLTGTSARGGPGGDAVDIFPTCPGNGGPGLELPVGASAVLRRVSMTGGAPGVNFIPGPGTCTPTPGPGVLGGGSVVHVRAFPRRLDTTRLTPDGVQLAVEVEGFRGDQVQIAFTPLAAFSLSSAGVSYVPPGSWPTVPVVGTLAADGRTTFMIPVPTVNGLPAAEAFHVQALMRDTNLRYHLSDARSVAVLARSAAPDCNGNGSFDVLDVLEGTVVDCQGDFVPDICQLATGAVPDCNANGVPDSCDIAAGTSPDVNLNGVPDECEFTPQVWFVDAGAPPGGDGSPQSPFDDLQDAVLVADHFDEISVAQGTYTGARNRGLTLSRRLVFRGPSGAAATVIDCEGLGQFASVPQGGHDLSLIGLTLRRGNAYNGGLVDSRSAVQASDCVFEDSIAGNWGACVMLQYVTSGSTEFRRCVFRRNRSHAFGGAIACHTSSLVAVECEFADNEVLADGGAIHLSSTQSAPNSVVSHSRFLSNRADRSGGALSTFGAVDVDVHECLFAGNVSNGDGGAISFDGRRCSIRGSTFAHNEAAASGGGLWLFESPFFVGNPIDVVNCVFYGNRAPTGPQCTLLSYTGGPELAHLILEGGLGAVGAAYGPLTNVGANVLDRDPLFVDPDGPDNLASTTFDNDYRLGAGSPGLDAGDVRRILPDTTDIDGNGNRTEPVPLDLRRAPRRMDDPAPDTGAGPAPLVDIGAFER